ncbi:putative sporulation protein YtaF [Anoxybacillus voinovskiensis]|uniref:Putative sporulation protein YtaF n=1 Tax=Anoxybacteroides voinovskiense TaxID=230470 RepID=A0A840E2H6_9BACL|nr:sporulation membrane protein YtaF [Anoxybacillus voinovskiensis]MBB4075386.1 putative sporulation protein YtaF [Anoxybacillus voinovskiensis]GGJ78903.1 sporulation membrane protein YtaF [Anoxybacillus voinovskiensis]
MLKYVSMMMLALAVSLDSLSVGVTYGMRKMKFPLSSLVVIALFSGFMLLMSMYVGSFLVLLLPVRAEKAIAACILVAIGVWAIYNVLKKREDELEEVVPRSAATMKIWRVHLKRLGIVIQILKRPSLADLDGSGSISMNEALLIGFALSMDAFGAGLSASLLGYSPLMLALLVSLLNMLFIRFGLKTGYTFAKTKIMKKATVIPGLILICLGISKIFF